LTGKDRSDCAASHLGVERQIAANEKSRRFRRRGPRSVEAVQKRADRFDQRRLCSDTVISSNSKCCQRSSPQEVGGEFPTIQNPIDLHVQPLNLLCVNIQSVVGKLTELCYWLNHVGIHIACLQETWLDASVTALEVPGYEIIARRDRSSSPNRGGILVLCRTHVNNVLLYKKSECAERAWLLIQRDSGSIALANWYRPPGEDTDLDVLQSEIHEIQT